MKENEKKRELLKGSCFNFINDRDVPYSVTPRVFYRQYPVQNYQNIKQALLQWGQNGKKTKKVTKKVKKSKNHEQCHRGGNFAGCKVFAALLLFFLLLSSSLFFWFLICIYELNLDSSWLS